MLGLEEDALVVFNVGLKLIVADHGVTEEAELVPCLLLLVIHELVGKFGCSMVLFLFFDVVTVSGVAMPVPMPLTVVATMAVV